MYGGYPPFMSPIYELSLQPSRNQELHSTSVFFFNGHRLRRLPHGHVLESFVDRKQHQVLHHRPFDQTLRKPFDHVWVKILENQVFTMNICCCCFLKYIPFLLLFVGKNIGH